MAEHPSSRRVRTLTHWGAYDIELEGQSIRAVHPFEDDPDPSAIGQSLVDAVDHRSRSRIRQPAVRRSWLEHGPGTKIGRRGTDPFVSLSWDEALKLVADELERVRRDHGNQAIFGGSYGWSSAGRFHHGQSQIHRFLNQLGGYTSAETGYSFAAAQVIVPHVFGTDFLKMISQLTAWPIIAEHTELVVMLGGIPLKNTQINGGGTGRHDTKGWLRHCRAHGTEFVNVSPLKTDAAEFLDAPWLAVAAAGNRRGQRDLVELAGPSLGHRATGNLRIGARRHWPRQRRHPPICNAPGVGAGG